jgi:glycerophosphoryl diester phosphodiesterase
MEPDPLSARSHWAAGTVGTTCMGGLFLVSLVMAAGAFDFFQPVQPPRAVQVMASVAGLATHPADLSKVLERCVEEGVEWAELPVVRSDDGRRLRVVGPHGLEAGLGEILQLASGRLNLCLDVPDAQVTDVAREILNVRMERQVMVRGTRDGLRRVRAGFGMRVAFQVRAASVGDAGIWEGLSDVQRPDAVEFGPGLVPSRATRDSLRRSGIRVQLGCEVSREGPEGWLPVVDVAPEWIRTVLPEEYLAWHGRRRVAASRPRISFHRGAGLHAPENTLPAFAKAARMGADFIEFDVRSTRDGGHYLLHDGRLDRTTSGRGPIAEVLSAEVDRLDAGSWWGTGFAGVRVPTLEAFLAETDPSIGLYLDAKAMEPEAVARVARVPGVRKRLVVYQAPAYLERLRALDPGIRLLPPLRRAEDLEPLVSRLRPYGVDAAWEVLSAGLIQRCHEQGVQVFSDALGGNETLDRYREAIRWGIDVIQTDHPLRVLRAMELELGFRGDGE